MHRSYVTQQIVVVIYRRIELRRCNIGHSYGIFKNTLYQFHVSRMYVFKNTPPSVFVAAKRYVELLRYIENALI
jgi:hypothetical protein